MGEGSIRMQEPQDPAEAARAALSYIHVNSRTSPEWKDLEERAVALVEIIERLHSTRASIGLPKGSWEGMVAYRLLESARSGDLQATATVIADSIDYGERLLNALALLHRTIKLLLAGLGIGGLALGIYTGFTIDAATPSLLSFILAGLAGALLLLPPRYGGTTLAVASLIPLAVYTASYSSGGSPSPAIPLYTPLALAGVLTLNWMRGIALAGPHGTSLD